MISPNLAAVHEEEQRLMQGDSEGASQPLGGTQPPSDAQLPETGHPVVLGPPAENDEEQPMLIDAPAPLPPSSNDTARVTFQEPPQVIEIVPPSVSTPQPKPRGPAA